MTAEAFTGIGNVVLTLEGRTEHCIFHGFSLDHPPFLLRDAKGIALCPIGSIASMAASNVTIWQFLSERIKFRWRLFRRRFQ
jgi:hypothetical protein